MATARSVSFGMLSDGLHRLYVREYIRFAHCLADGPERIRLRAQHRWLRDEWLAGPKGRLP